MKAWYWLGAALFLTACGGSSSNTNQDKDDDNNTPPVDSAAVDKAALTIAETDVQFSWRDNTADRPTQLSTESAINMLVQTLKDKGYADAALSANPFNVTFDTDLSVTSISGLFPELFQLVNPVKS